jgi:GR25 family glycosyltransferase involved in LPS biosynthesis
MANIKTVVIRLENIESSEILANECIKSGEKNELSISPFNGIYGEANIRMYERHFQIRPRRKIKKKRLGVQGCFLSHYSLWMNCLKTETPVLVLEHDAYILRPLPPNILNLFDEFLLLDPYNKMRSDYVTNHDIEREFAIEEYRNLYFKPKYEVSYEYAMGLQGYIIKPKAASKLIQDVTKNGYLPADIQCNKSIINIQTIYPGIVSINPKFYNDKSLMKQESTTHKKW